MKICVIGLGYIGFPTACVMANAGHEVVGVDTNREIVESLSNGRLHITNEAGLAELADSLLSSGQLRVATQAETADAFIICVPTPLKHGSTYPDLVTATEAASASESLNELDRPTADLSYVASAVQSIAPIVELGNLIVVESTVPPGTTEEMVLPILEQHGLTRDKVHLAHAPERVLPGAIMREMLENDRIIGGLTESATKMAFDLYASLVRGRILITDATTAELVKLMENTYRDVNIALANEFAQVADELGVDVQDAIRLANHHPRVNILSPGPGVGGHCIPVDPNFIIERTPDLTPLLQTARAINSRMPEYVAELVDEMTGEYGIEKVVILGAAYKPDVSDCRESPSFDIQRELVARGYAVSIHDPYIQHLDSPVTEACRGADLLLLATDHTAYKQLDPEVVAPVVAKPLLLDTRLSIPKARWEASGFIVRRLGDGRCRKELSVQG